MEKSFNLNSISNHFILFSFSVLVLLSDLKFKFCCLYSIVEELKFSSATKFKYFICLTLLQFFMAIAGVFQPITQQ